MRANVRPKASVPARREEVGDPCDVPCFKQALVVRLRRALPDDSGLADLAVLFGVLADQRKDIQAPVRVR